MPINLSTNCGKPMLYSVYLKVGKSKKQTYLIAFLDDASRYITYSQWSFSQNFSALRVVLKEAVARKNHSMKTLKKGGNL
ncbi:MAG: hypothetical protein PHR65_10000 [Syntrophomonadaceae bacterium]|nr:hypothetical protein [Syntrophomonadaceae bacterium]